MMKHKTLSYTQACMEDRLQEKEKKEGGNKNSEDEWVYMMKELVLHSRSVILLQAELILSVVSRPKCCLSRRPANAADAWGESLI